MGVKQQECMSSLERPLSTALNPHCWRPRAGPGDASIALDPAFDYTEWDVSWTGPSSGEQSPFEWIDGLVAGVYSLSLSSDEYTNCEATVDIVIEDPLAVEVLWNQPTPCVRVSNRVLYSSLWKMLQVQFSGC